MLELSDPSLDPTAENERRWRLCDARDPPRLRFSPSRQASFLRRIRENLQSVWTLPRGVLAVPRSAAGLPIHLLDESRTVRNARAQFGSIGVHAIVCAGLILVVWHPAATHLAKRPATGLGPFQSVAFAAPKWMREAA